MSKEETIALVMFACLPDVLVAHTGVRKAVRAAYEAGVEDSRKGLVKWDGKPFSCTDTVWIEPGRKMP